MNSHFHGDYMAVNDQKITICGHMITMKMAVHMGKWDISGNSTKLVQETSGFYIHPTKIY